MTEQRRRMTELQMENFLSSQHSHTHIHTHTSVTLSRVRRYCVQIVSDTRTIRKQTTTVTSSGHSKIETKERKKDLKKIREHKTNLKKKINKFEQTPNKSMQPKTLKWVIRSAEKTYFFFVLA